VHVLHNSAQRDSPRHQHAEPDDHRDADEQEPQECGRESDVHDVEAANDDYEDDE
jgi:hypothetical protein